MKTLRKILIRTPNWIGDHVLSQPFYRAVRAHYPESEITFLTVEALRDFDDTLFCNKKLILSSKERKISKAFFLKARTLCKEQYDLCFSLPASFSSAFFLFLTQSKNRVGFRKEGGTFFYHHSVSWQGVQSGKHKSLLFLSLLSGWADWVHLTPSTEDILKPPSLPKQKWIVFAPGASLPLREYPYFAEILLGLSKSFSQYKILIVGTEKKYHSQIKRLSLPNVEDHINKTTLSQLLQILVQAEKVLANDSGVAHLSATIAQTPTWVIYGPGNPTYISPLGKNSFALRAPVPCSPCEKAYCQSAYGYQICLRSLAPDTILQALKNTM